MRAMSLRDARALGRIHGADLAGAMLHEVDVGLWLDLIDADQRDQCRESFHVALGEAVDGFRSPSDEAVTEREVAERRAVRDYGALNVRGWDGEDRTVADLERYLDLEPFGSALSGFLLARVLAGRRTVVFLPSLDDARRFRDDVLAERPASIVLDAVLNGLIGGIMVRRDAGGVHVSSHT